MVQDDPQQPDPGGQPAAQPPTAAASSYGHPVYDQIGSFIKQYTGKDATQQGVSQWGTNVDAQYMRKINDAIYNSADAVAYRASQAKPPAAAPTTPAPTTGGTPANTGQGATSPVTSTGGIPPPASPAPSGVAPTYQTHLSPAPAAATYQAPTLNVQGLTSQQPQTAAQTALLMALLQHPESMSELGVNQLKEQQKEAALSMQQQQGAQFDQNAASRGVWGGGTQAAAHELGNEATRSQILNAYRGIDLQKMQQDQQDKLNVLGIADSTLSGQQNRDINSGNYSLNAQMQQEALRQAAAGSAFNAWNADQTRQLQQDQGNQGLGLDYAKLGEAGRQFNQGNILDWFRARDSSAQGWAGLDQASQIAMLHALGLG